jgi:predicted amidohydrolase YtcJ
MNGTTTLHADTIVTNAKIATMDPARPQASAVAVRNGEFVAVGTEEEVMTSRGPTTRIIDAKGHTMIPGLHDSHLHVIRGGRLFNLELRWDGVPTLAQALEMLREQVERTPPGQWVRVVGGWSEFQFKERRMPTLDELNEIAPETPVFVLHLYHLALLNRAALQYVGYTKDTPDQEGAYIERDGSGQPTGLIMAKPNAAILYATLSKGPFLSPEDELNSTRHFLRELNRFGITSICDAGGGTQHYPQDYQIYTNLANQGLLTVRTAYSLFTQNPGNELADYEKWCAEVSPNDGSDFLKVNGCGELLTYVGYDFEDFPEPQPMPPANMSEIVRPVLEQVVAHNFPFRLHATYDESIDVYLGIIEQLAKEYPLAQTRWWFDHCETISKRNIDRVAALNGGIAIQDRLAFQGEYFVDRYGVAKAANAPPIEDMLEAGVHVGAGTDATRVSTYNPFVSLYWLHTGETLGGLVTNGPRNRLTREKALELYTVGSAWMSGDVGKKGAIKAGQFADFALLSADYFSVTAAEIKQIESVLTVVGGKIAYAAGPFESLGPPPIHVAPEWSPVKKFGGYYREPQAVGVPALARCTHAFSHGLDLLVRGRRSGFPDLCDFA